MKTLLVVVVAVLLLALAGGTTHAQMVIFLELKEHGLWRQVNDYRRAQGLQEVLVNAELIAAAEWMSEDLADEEGRLDHIDSQGRDAGQRIADFDFGDQNYRGENLAWGMSDSLQVLAMWKASWEHNETLLNPGYTMVGVSAIYSEDSPYGWYWTMTFGGPPAPSSSTDFVSDSGGSTSDPYLERAPSSSRRPAEFPHTGASPQ